MKKTIVCECCEGTGKIEISICDKYGSDDEVGKESGMDICQKCWAEELSEEDVRNL